MIWPTRAGDPIYAFNREERKTGRRKHDGRTQRKNLSLPLSFRSVQFAPSVKKHSRYTIPFKSDNVPRPLKRSKWPALSSRRVERIFLPACT